MLISILSGRSLFSSLILHLAVYSAFVQAIDKQPAQKNEEGRQKDHNTLSSVISSLSSGKGKENEKSSLLSNTIFSDSTGSGDSLDNLGVVIVNTLDGYLHGIAKSDGRLLWTTVAESDDSSSMVNVVKHTEKNNRQSFKSSLKWPDTIENQKSKDLIISPDNGRIANQNTGQYSTKLILPLSNVMDDIIFIPEPAGNGNLYYTSSSMFELQKFNISLRDIVDKNLGVIEGGFVFTGGKVTTVIAINSATGEVLRSFGSSFKQQCVDADYNDEQQKCKVTGSISDAVFISKTRYHLEIHSIVGKALWNISFYEFKPASSSPILKKKDLPKHDLLSVITDVKGNFKLLKDTNEFMFQTEFNAPVLNAFDVVTGNDGIHLISIDASEGASKTNRKGYIGNYEGSFYLLSDKNFPLLQKNVDKNQDLVDECMDAWGSRKECLIGTYLLEDDQQTLPPSPQEHLQIPYLQILFDGFVYYAGAAIAPLIFLGLWKHRFKFSEFWIPYLFDWKRIILETEDDDIKSSFELNSIPEQIDFDTKQPPGSDEDDSEKVSSTLSKKSEPSLLPSTSNSGLKVLSVSEKILGYGSHGTIVLQGTFENRPVAIKRMLSDFYDVADHEVKLLQESDEHPNVVRYFFKEECDGFMYVALEKCAGTLAEFVEGKDVPELNILRSHVSLKQMIAQIASGLAHLHSLNIAHRDIKPQNILVTSFRTDKIPSTRTEAALLVPRLLISDFGLGKRLEDGQSSFHNTFVPGGNVAGTFGWRAPESLLAHKIAAKNLETSNVSDSNDSDGIFGRSSPENNDVGSSDKKDRTMSPEKNKKLRVTKAIDIFSAGCVFYYLLTNGSHPFGDRFSREINIVKGNFRFNYKERGKEALLKLIQRMISRDPQKRPSAESVKRHPYFWSPSKQLIFLQDLSDRLEEEVRDPPSPLLTVLERQANNIIGRDWPIKVDRYLLEDMQKFRKYEGGSLQDLLRVIRNKKHHYQDLSPYLKKRVGALPDGFLDYFTSRFPNLVVSMVTLVENNRDLIDEPMFDQYFIRNADQL